MDGRTLAIPIAFILLAALLCWMLIYSKGKWWLKLATIVIVPGFGLVVWSSISSYKGWPTADEPPEKAVLVWGIIHEPDPRNNDPGSIYLWLLPINEGGETNFNPFDYVSGGGEPRSYKLPYTRQLHDALNGGLTAAKDGRPMMFSRNPKRGGGRHPRGPRFGREGEPEEGESGGRGGAGDGADGDGESYQFYDLPPASPRKDPER